MLNEIKITDEHNLEDATSGNIAIEAWTSHVDRLSVGVFLKDSSSRFRYVNRAFQAFVCPASFGHIYDKQSTELFGSIVASGCWYHDELARLTPRPVSILVNGPRKSIPGLVVTKVFVPVGDDHQFLGLVTPSQRVADLEEVPIPAAHRSVLDWFEKQNVDEESNERGWHSHWQPMLTPPSRFDAEALVDQILCEA